MSVLEWVAAAFGFLSVLFYIQRNQWSWPTGLVQVLLYIVVFWNAKLYADMLLHVVYVVLQIYGWRLWNRQIATPSVSELPIEDRIVVRRLSIPLSMVLTLSIVAMTGIIFQGLRTFTDAQSPLPDSFIAAASLIAQLLLAHRYWENWVIWIVVDIVAIFLFTARELYPTAALYVLFLGMATWGAISWNKKQHEEST